LILHKPGEWYVKLNIAFCNYLVKNENFLVAFEYFYAVACVAWYLNERKPYKQTFSSYLPASLVNFIHRLILFLQACPWGSHGICPIEWDNGL